VLPSASSFADISFDAGGADEAFVEEGLVNDLTKGGFAELLLLVSLLFLFNADEPLPPIEEGPRGLVTSKAPAPTMVAAVVDVREIPALPRPDFPNGRLSRRNIDGADDLAGAISTTLTSEGDFKSESPLALIPLTDVEDLEVEFSFTEAVASAIVAVPAVAGILDAAAAAAAAIAAGLNGGLEKAMLFLTPCDAIDTAL